LALAAAGQVNTGRRNMDPFLTASALFIASTVFGAIAFSLARKE
jgi:hypothetical protein